MGEVTSCQLGELPLVLRARFRLEAFLYPDLVICPS